MDRTTRLRVAAASLLGLSLPLATRAAPRSHERHPAPAHHPLPEHQPMRATLTQVLTLPAGIPSGGFVLQNPTGAALAARDRSTGIGFAMGSVAGTATSMAVSIGGTAAIAQLDVHSQWPDGSARWASITLPAPTLAAGGSVSVTPGATSTAGTVMVWPGSSDSVTLFGSTLPVGPTLNSSTDTWQSGPLAVQRRADMPVPGDATGAMHLVMDETRYADGTCIADVQFRRDVATLNAAGTGTQAAALAPLSYTATINACGTTTTQAVANQNQYQDWHLVVGDDGINVQHDVAGLEATGLVPPYDLTMGIATGSNSYYAGLQQAMAAAGFGAPLANNGVLVGMNTTGGRPDIGITTGPVAIWLRSQDDATRRFALAQADTGGAVPWHMWDASKGRWVDVIDHPNAWFDTRSKPGSYTDYLANAMPAQDTTNTPSAQPWDIATSHAPNLNYIPALLTGSRYYRDMQQAQAAFAMVNDYTPNREAVGATSPGGDSIFGGGTGGSAGDLEVRAIAWNYRETVEAWALAPNGGTPSAHLAKILSDSWAWWNDPSNEPTWATQQGSPGPIVPGRYLPGIYAPWEQDYLVAAVGMGALLGDPGAAPAFPSVVGSRERMGNIQSGYDPKWSIAYNDYYTNSGGGYLPTFPAFQAAQIAQNNGSASQTPAYMDSTSNYASLLRMSMAMALRINPSDTLAPGVLNDLYGAITSSTSNISTATYQGASPGGQLVQEALAIPAVTPDPSWTNQEAALAAGGSGSSSTGTGSSGSSTGTSSSTGSSTTGSATGTASTAGTVLATTSVTLPYPGEPLTVPIGGLHLATANGATVASAAGAIPVTATSLPAGCHPGDAYYVHGARLGTQTAGAGLDAPGYCNAAGQVVLTATGLPPTF